MMNAVVMHKFGPPSVLKYEAVPPPEPGPGEVAVAVHAVSVNRTLDCLVRAGSYRVRPTLPHVLGNDPAGVVAAVLVRRVDLAQPLGDAVFGAEVGKLVGPVQAGQGFLVFKVEEFMPAVLDEAIKNGLRKEIFDAWLRNW